jgi:hypothetical protein
VYLNFAVILNIILSLCKGYWSTLESVYQLYSTSTVQSLKQKAMGEILKNLFMNQEWKYNYMYIGM